MAVMRRVGSRERSKGKLRARIVAVAAMWVASYGSGAPDQIREWARDPLQSRDAAAFLEQTACAAETMLDERRIVVD